MPKRRRKRQLLRASRSRSRCCWSSRRLVRAGSTTQIKSVADMRRRPARRRHRRLRRSRVLRPAIARPARAAGQSRLALPTSRLRQSSSRSAAAPTKTPARPKAASAATTCSPTACPSTTSSPKPTPSTPSSRSQRLAAIAQRDHLTHIVVVSDGTHLFRIALLCRRAGLNVYTSPRAPLGHIDDFDAAKRTLHEILSYTAWRLSFTAHQLACTAGWKARRQCNTASSDIVIDQSAPGLPPSRRIFR